MPIVNLYDSAIPSPCFVLELGRLRENRDRITRVRRQAEIEILLALKGFAMIRAFPEIARVASGATISSLNEAKHAKLVFGDNLHAYAPVYIDSEFGAIAELCGHITFNSVAQFERFRGRARGRSLGLRVNPGYSDVATDLYNPCAPGSRLGVDAALLGEGLPEGLDGLHVHNLCESDAEATAVTIARVEELFAAALQEARWLNLGGGHLMTRRGYDIALLVESLRGFRDRHPDLRLILEPGAAFVWDAGVLVATVLDIVENRGIPTAMLDVSFACHLPDCLEMPYTPKINGATIIAHGKGGWRLGGCSCLAGDFVGEYVFERDPEIGDRIIFRDMMHYTMVKTTMFNGVNLPAIGVLDTDGSFEVLRTFGYPDYAARLG